MKRLQVREKIFLFNRKIPLLESSYQSLTKEEQTEFSEAFEYEDQNNLFRRNFSSPFLFLYSKDPF